MRSLARRHTLASSRFSLASLASLAAPVAVGVLFAATPARADNATAGAIEELKQGYVLKQAGNCHDALPHFARSFQLDPKPKAALNMADCEQRAGDLISARNHAVQGRDLARQKRSSDLVAIASEQIAAIEKRIPKLTIALAPDAPPDTTVTRDGTPLDASSLGVAVSVNPGPHVVSISAPNHVERQVQLTLADEASTTIEVAPGALLGAPMAAKPATPDDGGGTGPFSPLTTRKLVALGLAGVGLVGMTVGIATGVAAGSKHDALERECVGNDCPVAAKDDLDGFHALKTWSTVGYVIGLAGLAGSATLWLTSPSARPGGSAGAAQLWVGPGSVRIAGTF